MPIAPAWRCRRAMSGDLSVFACGRSSPGPARGGLHALDVGIERSRLDHERRRFDAAQHGIVRIKRGQRWPYSITSSARASSMGEISRPSALAVLKFTAVWKCDSCRMEVSPALAPFAT